MRTKILSLCIVFLAYFGHFSSLAYGTNEVPNSPTNRVYDTNYINVLIATHLREYRPDSETDFINNLENEIRKSSDIPMDKIGPFSTLRWIRISERENYGVIEKYTEAGQKTVEDIIAYSSREAFAKIFSPEEGWEFAKDDFNDTAFMKFFRDSVGNTREEKVDFQSAEYSSSEKKWYQKPIMEKWESGFRPINSSPYAFTRYTFVNKHDRRIATVHMRYYLRHFVEQRIGAGVTFPLKHNYQFRVSGSFDPLNINASDEQNLSLRLERSVGKKFNSGAFFVGTSFNREGTTVDLGYRTPWGR